MTPMTVDCTMDRLNLSLLRGMPECKLWQLYAISSNETEQVLILKENERRKFMAGKITPKEIMTNPELFLKFIEKKEQDQNGIGNSLKSSTFVEDSLSLFSAYNFGFQKKGTRLAKNGTLKKLKRMVENDDREGLDDFWNSRARSGTHTVYTTDNVDTYHNIGLYSLSAEEEMFNQLDEEEAEELEAAQLLANLVDRKLQETQRIGLFEVEDLEVEYVKAGNKYPKKVVKVRKDDAKYNFNLFDMMEV